MRSDAAPVIVEDKLKEVLATGRGGLRIVCADTPTRRGSSWGGDWHVYAVTDEGERWVLMTYRLAQRTFKSLAGISSLVIDLGLPRLMVPHHEGEAYELWMDGRYRLFDPNGDLVSSGSFS